MRAFNLDGFTWVLGCGFWIYSFGGYRRLALVATCSFLVGLRMCDRGFCVLCCVSGFGFSAVICRFVRSVCFCMFVIFLCSCRWWLS